MEPSEVRQRVLSDHERLRRDVEQIEGFANEIMKGLRMPISALRAEAKELVARLRAHMHWEESYLLPALRDADAWEPNAPSIWFEITANSATDWTSSSRASTTQRVRGTSSRATSSTSSILLREDMRLEEQELLDERVLRDDIVAIDVVTADPDDCIGPECLRIDRNDTIRDAPVGYAQPCWVRTTAPCRRRACWWVASARATHANVLVAGVAGLVAGAMSMAAGEYVSVSSQADTERADVERERREQARNDAYEHEELAAIYVARGLDPSLAKQVAAQLMARDALGAHSRDELGISDALSARPIQAALASAATFAVGAAVPLMTAVVVPETSVIPFVVGSSLLCLAFLGGLATGAGGAPRIAGVRRILFWGRSRWG
jgi:VIT1/CCC1 family predicted Fe2+/Mn2+ transporter